MTDRGEEQMEIPVYFPGDRYETPENIARPFLDKLLLGSRWYFYLSLIDIQRRHAPLARAGKYNRALWAAGSMEAFRRAESVGCRFRMSGIDNIRKDPEKPLVIISNHMSTLETIVFPGIFAGLRPITFVIKESIVRNPLFRDIMKATDPIVVSRKNPRDDLKKVMSEGVEHLKKGTSVIVFPQSTRTDGFDPAHFNSMGAKLAKTAGARLMPGAIKTDFWGNGGIKAFKEFGPLHRDRIVHMEFGEPISLTGNGSEEHLATIEFIRTRMERWQSEK